MTTAIVDYGSGNLHSAHKALERAARGRGQGKLRETIAVTGDPDAVRRADRVVLPGVGAFADCRRGLDAVEGMVEAMEEAVLKRGRPFLGICVGLQLMATTGHEHGAARGLGWLPGEVVPIEPHDPALKIPHMGWNTLRATRSHPILAGIADGEDGLHAYFVHSFHLAPEDGGAVIAQTDYGAPLTAVAGRDNMVGTQFHPEKSQALGLALLANFLDWRP